MPTVFMCRGAYTRTLQQVSEMVAFGDLNVAGGDLLEGAGLNVRISYELSTSDVLRAPSPSSFQVRTLQTTRFFTACRLPVAHRSVPQTRVPVLVSQPLLDSTTFVLRKMAKKSVGCAVGEMKTVDGISGRCEQPIPGGRFLVAPQVACVLIEDPQEGTWRSHENSWSSEQLNRRDHEIMRHSFLFGP